MTTVAIAGGAAATGILVGGAVVLLFLKWKRRVRQTTSTLTVQPGSEMITGPMTVPMLPASVDPLTSTATVQPGSEMITAPMTVSVLPASVDQGLNDAALEAATQHELRPPMNVE